MLSAFAWYRARIAVFHRILGILAPYSNSRRICSTGAQAGNKPNSVVGNHLSGPCVATRLWRATFNRESMMKHKFLLCSCSRVRILPFHSTYILLYVASSLFASLALPPAGVTRYLSSTDEVEKEFGLSSIYI